MLGGSWCKDQGTRIRAQEPPIFPIICNILIPGKNEKIANVNKKLKIFVRDA